MTEVKRRFRLFPALIVVLAGSLLFKLAAFSSGMQAMMDDNAAVALETEAVATPAQVPAAQEQQDSGSATADMAVKKMDDADKLPTSPYPENWTREEVELMLGLAERKRELDVREAAIRDKEAVLLAVEKRIDTKIAEIKSIETSVNALLNTFDENEKAKFKKLKDMIIAMVDKDAAAFLGGLEVEDQVEIMREMDSKKASKILVKMERGAAVELAQRLAEIKQAPGLNDVR